MNKSIQAVYENGVFKPKPFIKIDLQNHSEVNLRIENVHKKNKKCSSRNLDPIDKLIGTVKSVSDLSVNHDKYIYCK